MPSNGAFVQQTPLFNLQYLDIDPALKELLVQMNQQINNIAMAVNMKDTGYYDVNEFVCGQVYYPIPDPTGQTNFGWRPVMRKVIDWGKQVGPLPNGACFSTPHNIPVINGYFFTHIYGVAADPVNKLFLQFPFVSSTDKAHDIQVDVTATNVEICCGADYSAYTKVNIILEYVTMS